MLVATYAVRNLIRDGKSGQIRNQIATGAQFGMSTLESSLSELVAHNVITWDEALNHSPLPEGAEQAGEPPRRGGDGELAVVTTASRRDGGPVPRAPIH